MNKEKIINFLFRASIAFAFLWPALSAHIRPENWLGYFPAFILDSGIPESLVLWGFTLFHLIIVIWMITGRFIFIPSIVAVVFLTAVVVMNLSQMDVLFRDISLALVAIALAIQSYPFRAPNILKEKE